MIKSFRFKNFLSFKEEVVFSLMKDKTDATHKGAFCTIQGDELLKSAVVYGSNAAGKSNFSKAFVFFHNFIVSSFNNALNNHIPTVPFLLNDRTEKQPSLFEIEIYTKKNRYVYGFTVSQRKVVREWLHQYPQKKVLFERDNNGINSNKRHLKEATASLEKQTRPNVLFLSLLAAHNGVIANELVEAIKKINVYPSERRDLIVDLGFRYFEKYEKEILEFLQEADFNLDKIVVEQKEIGKDEFANTLPGNFPRQLIDFATTGSNKVLQRKASTLHTKYDDNGERMGEVIFDFMTQESGGTKQMFGYAALFINALKKGKTLFIDELDSSLHPLLCQFIVKIFNSKERNPKNAQLIFTTHDVNLLDNDNFRRDQVFFVDKDRYGASLLFSLSELGERKDLSYRKRYIEGRYGALPYIRNNERQWE